MADKHDLEFDVLSDQGNEVAGRYNLAHGFPEDLKSVYENLDIDLPRFNGDDSWTLPLPARYIIDRDQVVQYAKVSADYKVRPEPEDTLDALKAL